jgi:hypothetical protein
MEAVGRAVVGGVVPPARVRAGTVRVVVLVVAMVAVGVAAGVMAPAAAAGVAIGMRAPSVRASASSLI